MSVTIDDIFGPRPDEEKKDEKKEVPEEVKKDLESTVQPEQPEPTPKGDEPIREEARETPVSQIAASPDKEETPATDISDILGAPTPAPEQEEIPEKEDVIVEPQAVTVPVPAEIPKEEETPTPSVPEATTTETPVVEVPQQETPVPEPTQVIPAASGQASIDDIFGPSPAQPSGTTQVEAAVEPVLQVDTDVITQPVNILTQGLARTELPPPPLPKMPEKFDTSPEPPGESRTFMIYGEKGDSKTTTALSFPGKIAALSFDHKTVEIWAEFFENDPRITVYDAIRYMDYSSPDA